MIDVIFTTLKRILLNIFFLRVSIEDIMKFPKLKPGNGNVFTIPIIIKLKDKNIKYPLKPLSLEKLTKPPFPLYAIELGFINFTDCFHKFLNRKIASEN